MRLGEYLFDSIQKLTLAAWPLLLTSTKNGGFTLGFKRNVRWARIWEMENRELRSALRAEKAHIEQLQRKLVILQELIPA